MAEVRLFNKVDEKWNLLLPFLLLPFLIASVVFDWGKTPGEILVMATVAAIFLISTLHLGFTWANLLSLPEFKSIMERKRPGAWINNWMKVGVVYFSVLLVGLFVNQFIRIPYKLDHVLMINIYSGLYLLMSRYHTIMQLRGLAQLYSYKIKEEVGLNNEELRRLESAQKRENLGFHLLFYACGLQAFYQAFLNRNVISTEHKIGYLILALVIVLAIFINTSQMPKIQTSSKRLFLVRTFYYILVPINYMATIISEVIHGMEYLFVTKEMRANSKTKKNNMLLYSTLFFCGFVSVVWILSGHQPLMKYIYQGSIDQIPRASFIISSVNIANAITHYYLDGIIFQFRDPMIRSDIGPLLGAKVTNT